MNAKDYHLEGRRVVVLVVILGLFIVSVSLALALPVPVTSQGAERNMPEEDGELFLPLVGNSWPYVYRLGMFEDVATVNLWAYLGQRESSTIWTSYVLGNLVHTLYGSSHHFRHRIPILAADFPAAPVQQGAYWVVTIPLKEGIQWSDGAPFTAEDVAFTANTVLELDLEWAWANMFPSEMLDRVEVADPYTVRFYFTSEPNWYWSTLQATVLPQHFWEPIVEQAKTQPDPAAWLYAYEPQEEPVLGPFMVAEWMPGQYVRLARNSHYFFEGLQVTVYANGAYHEELPDRYTFTAYGTPTGTVDLEFTVGPHVGGVTYSIYPDQSAAFQALLDDQVDFVLNPLGLRSETWESLVDHPAVTTVANQDYGMFYLAFNTRRFPMDVLEFRQAVATLIDKEFPGESVFDGTQPLYSFVPSGNRFWHNPDAPQIGADLTREERISATVELLTGAGFTWDVEPGWDPIQQEVIPGEGLRHEGELVPEIELLTYDFNLDSRRATAALETEEWLNEAGISATAVLTDFQSILEPVFQEADFDVYIGSWSLGNPSYPDYLESFFHSRNDTALTGNFNMPGYNNPVYDALVDDFMSTSNVEQARDDVLQAQAILAEELPYVLLYTAQVREGYRGNRVTFPYVDTLDGLVNVRGLPALVRPNQ